MTDTEKNEALDTQDPSLEGTEEESSEKVAEHLDLEVKVDSPSSCQRHLTITVSRKDVDRYLNEQYDELLPKAEVPGFRPGKAPKRLVVNRFKEHVSEQVKAKLLMDSMTQLSEEHEFSPISEPEIDLNAIEVPDEGPMTFEFDVEVRPEFELPEWRGLTLEKPVHEVTDEDIDQQLSTLLQKYGKVVEQSGPAEMGDMVTLELEAASGDRVLSRSHPMRITLRPVLSLRDARIDNFGEVVAGAVAGDRRETEVAMSSAVSDTSLAGQTVRMTFHVQKIERVELPKMTASFLDEIGGFQSEEELRGLVAKSIERQQAYRANQSMRDQITRNLTLTATWDLPPTLLERQSRREVRRVVLELQSSGYSNEMIQAHANRLEQNIFEYTARALKEHFILERIAEEEKIDVDEQDYDAEIERIAEQEGIPPRRVRARLEKRGDLDAVRNQILERKVIEKIVSHATVIETPEELKRGGASDDVMAIDYSLVRRRDASAIPEAKHGEEASKKLPS